MQVPNWDTIRRVEQLNTAKAAAVMAAKEAAAKDAAAKEAAAREAASKAAATASSLGISGLDSDDEGAHHGGTPLDHLQVCDNQCSMVSFPHLAMHPLCCMVSRL